MDTDDDSLLDMFESVTLAALDRIGDDPKARYAFFKRFIALARGATGGRGLPGGGFSIPRCANAR